MVSEFHAYLEFLEFYLHGLVTEGVLTPLVRFSVRRSDVVGNDVGLLYQLQLEGKSPQESFRDSRLKMPQALKDLFTLGFEKSVIDLVLGDVIAALRLKRSNEEVSADLTEIQKKYSKTDVDAICANCAGGEIEKIFARATLEGAHEVIIQQDGDFLVQKYLGPKLVTIREAAIPAVHASLKEAFKDQKNKIQIKFL